MVKRTPSSLGRFLWFSFVWAFFGFSPALVPTAFAQSQGIIGARAALNGLSAESHAIASAADLTGTGEAATLTFTLSAPVEASAFVLGQPDRVIIDLPAVSFELDPETGKPLKPEARRKGMTRSGHLVDSFRFGSFAPGRSRIVIDLSGPARVVKTEVVQVSGKDGFQLIIQLAKTDRDTFEAAVQAARSIREAAPVNAPAAAIETRASSPATLPRIVLDPGHGGVDSGAMANGLIEKTIVLDFAKALAAKLIATGRYDVVMTRDDDTFISLGERVKMARDRDAALFVSIHADTLSEADVTGATVYTVSNKASDSEAARVAEKENLSDSAAGVEGKDEANGISDILFDLTRRETRTYSHVFAHTLANYWKVAARLNKNPERSAGFKVLTAPDVPSVLLELGYLSNEKDAAALNSPDWRDKATAQVANAIENYFSARGVASEKAVPGETAVDVPIAVNPASEPDTASPGATVVSDAKPLSLSHSTAGAH